MKKTLLIGAALVALTAVQAQALEVKQYVSLKGNWSSMKNTYKTAEYDAEENAMDHDKTKLNDKTFGGSLAYGVKLGDFRTELEGNLGTSAEKDGKDYSEEDGSLAEKWKFKLKTKSVMLNGYYDIPTGIALRPYVGAGVGLAHVKGVFKFTDYEAEGTTDKYKMSKTKFVYQLGAGVAYELTQNWAVDAGYRYMDYGTITKKNNWSDGDFSKDKLSVKSHNVYLGLRYTF